MTDIELLVTIGNAFAYLGGLSFIAIGIFLSYRAGRLHPFLLICISAISICWIEAPYDWAMYAQFPAELPRMPEWWPLNMTWGGLPSAVPVGYIAYFVLPPVIAVGLSKWICSQYQLRRPLVLLTTGLGVGFIWAFGFNGFFGALLGVFRYGYVIEGLAIREGTIYQYPVYDSLAIGIQSMIFTYLLGRTNAKGESPIEMWAAEMSPNPVKASLLSIIGAIIIGHVVYLSVFTPHLITKQLKLVNVGPEEQLFEGIENQPWP